jgi:hypothetical protein
LRFRCSFRGGACDRAVDGLDGQPDSDRHLTRRLAEERVQLCPMHREARPDGCPQLGDVDLTQQPAMVVVEALVRDCDSS